MPMSFVYHVRVFRYLRAKGLVMKKTSIVMIAGISSALFGCASPVPVAENFPVSYQKVARTAHHWDVVAGDLVAQTTEKINATPGLQNRTIHLPRKPDATSFDAAMRDLMITHLVKRDLPVSVCNTGSNGQSVEQGDSDLRIQYEARVIQHHASMRHYRPGELTALGAGVAVLRNAAFSELSRGQENIALMGGLALADALAGTVASPTKTEILITTSIAENNRYVFRRSDIYYVPDNDVGLFIESAEQSATCPGEQASLSEAAKARNERLRAEEKRRADFNWNMCRLNRYWCDR